MKELSQRGRLSAFTTRTGDEGRPAPVSPEVALAHNCLVCRPSQKALRLLGGGLLGLCVWFPRAIDERARV